MHCTGILILKRDRLFVPSHSSQLTVYSYSLILLLQAIIMMKVSLYQMCSNVIFTLCINALIHSVIIHVATYNVMYTFVCKCQQLTRYEYSLLPRPSSRCPTLLLLYTITLLRFVQVLYVLKTWQHKVRIYLIIQSLQVWARSDLS